MAAGTPQQRFESSCARAADYPQNLLRTHKFEYALRTYYARLCKSEGGLFHPIRRSIFFWDLPDDANEFSAPFRITSHEDLKDFTRVAPLQPRSRFVFLQTTSSRGPMCCTKEQFTYILSYLQVMPSFLEFCFEFVSREDPVSTTLFRQEDYIGKRHQIQHHGRSGKQIQHAFNVIGLEEETIPGEYSWPFRHVTVYHSFDVERGKSLWIVIKGNRVIRELITTSAAASQEVEGEAMRTPAGAFVTSLRVQLLILEWCTHYWAEYISSLEYQAKKSSATVNQSPVPLLVSNTQRTLVVSRQSTMEPMGRSRQNTDLSRPETSASRRPRIPRFMREWSSLSRMTSGFSTHSQAGASVTGTGTGTVHSASSAPRKMKDVTLEDIFTFDELQAIHTLSAAVDKAHMMIEQNKRVLIEIRERYTALAESSDFQHVFDVESCDADIMNFVRQIRSMEGDFDNHQTRLRTLLRRLEKDEALFSGVLQYQSMQTGEYLSKAANLSAVKMEEWTIKMHNIAARTEQETVAMGIITFFTLVLLPCTFVATFFSSNIIKFDDDKAGSSKMGDWSVHRPALSLFLVMSLPLMGITLITWALYRSAAFRRAREKLEELPFSEKPVNSDEA